MNNEWYQIEGRNNYFITRDGRVARLVGGKYRELKPQLKPNGYTRFSFSGEKVPLHRLLAITFIPNPDNLPIVRHLNDIKADNRLENLAWGTNADNSRDMIDNFHNVNQQKTHCPRNHEYTEETTYYELRKDGTVARHCRICRAENYRKWKAEHPPTKQAALNVKRRQAKIDKKLVEIKRAEDRVVELRSELNLLTDTI